MQCTYLKLNRGSAIYGLSSLVDDLKIPILPPLGAKYRLDVSNVSMSGTYDANLDILSGVTAFEGTGEYIMYLQNAFVDFVVEIRLVGLISPKIEITKLELDLGFEKSYIEAKGAQFNGVEANWTEINPELRQIFDIYWPVLNSKLIGPLKDIVNGLIKVHLINSSS